MSNVTENEIPLQWFYVTEAGFPPYKLLTPHKNTTTIWLAGENMLDQMSLMDTISAAMDFPVYFGRNWNALEDCLRDLQWLPAKNYQIVWKDASCLLFSSPVDFTTFLEVMLEVAEWWRGYGVGFELWIQDDFILKMVGFCKEAHIMV